MSNFVPAKEKLEAKGGLKKKETFLEALSSTVKG